MCEVGWKYNLDAHCHRRRKICARYEAAFRGLDGVELPTVSNESWSARHLFTIWVDAARRDDIIADLEQCDIGVAVNYRAVHLLTYYAQRFGYHRGDFPVAESIGNRTISLPLFPQMTGDQVSRVIEAVKQVVGAGATSGKRAIATTAR